MAVSYFRDFPPYLGDEPYVYLCFHESDARAVLPLLDALTQRRCRVWYSMGSATNAIQHHERTTRADNAALMICYLTPRAAENERIKSSLGCFQATGKRVICVESGECTERSGFQLLLTERVRRVACAPNETAEELVSTLLRTEGFSQQLLAENDAERQLFLHKRKSRRLALTILPLAAVALVCALIYAFQMGLIHAPVKYADEITIQDAVILRAARNALIKGGDASLTQAGIDDVKTLHLDAVPASFDELALFPALTRLEIPQDCVQDAAEHLLGADFTIVVYPEAKNACIF